MLLQLGVEGPVTNHVGTNQCCRWLAGWYMAATMAMLDLILPQWLDTKVTRVVNVQ